MQQTIETFTEQKAIAGYTTGTLLSMYPLLEQITVLVSCASSVLGVVCLSFTLYFHIAKLMKSKE